jgi:hypothetical protein
LKRLFVFGKSSKNYKNFVLWLWQAAAARRPAAEVSPTVLSVRFSTSQEALAHIRVLHTNVERYSHNKPRALQENTLSTQHLL